MEAAALAPKTLIHGKWMLAQDTCTLYMYYGMTVAGFPCRGMLVKQDRKIKKKRTL